MPTPFSSHIRPRLFLLGLTVPALLCTAAAAPPLLTVPAGAVATLQPGTVPLNGPQQRELVPGVQVCVGTGSATVAEGGVRRLLTAGQCFQVPAPRSLVSSLRSLAASWVPSSRKAGTVNAESRGEDRCGDRAPGVALPTTYALETLAVPVASRPYPNALEVTSGINGRLYRAEKAAPGADFTVPTAALQRADHMDIRDGAGKLLYRGAVSHVVFSERGDDEDAAPAAQARQLLETGLLEYALPAYSLLKHAGEQDAANELLTVIRACFVVPPPEGGGQR